MTAEPVSKGDTAPDPQREARAIIDGMRRAVAQGDEHWFIAVLEAIRRWPLAREQVGDRSYCYLIGGEAFDWLLLAERLCDEIADLIPEEECEALLFHGRLPLDLSEEEIQRYLGVAKYRAHLNFVYGVRVEEALQLAVQGEVQKERLSRIWENGAVDDEAWRRIYGASWAELLQAFRRQHPALSSGNELSLGELREFAYWLFRHRLRCSDPARVASDTRKGLALLAQMEARRSQALSLR